MPNRRMALAALAISLGLGLAACASDGHKGAGPAGQAHLTDGQRHGRCPQGRLLPAGEGEAIDYIDFFQLAGKSYDMVRLPVRASQLGPVIGHIRCSLIASEDPHRGPVPVVNGTASFLPAGAAVYQVRDFLPACRLAAYLHGRLQVYFAQASVTPQRTATPVSCAERPERSGQQSSMQH
jgi:hypothetical protein